MDRGLLVVLGALLGAAILPSLLHTPPPEHPALSSGSALPRRTLSSQSTRTTFARSTRATPRLNATAVAKGNQRGCVPKKELAYDRCFCTFPADEPHKRRSIRGWEQFHQKLCRDARKAAGVEVVWYGDSITEAWRGTSVGMISERAEGVPRVWNTLFEDKKNNTKTSYLALGISGDQTQHLLGRLESCELLHASNLQPKIVILAIGTNNLGAGCTAYETNLGVRKVVHTVKRLRPKAKILLLGLLPRALRTTAGRLEPANNIFTRRIQEVNQGMEKLAGEDPDKISYLDAWDIFNGSNSSNQVSDTIPKYLMPDFLHPSAEGHMRWGQRVKQAVEKMLSSTVTIQG